MIKQAYFRGLVKRADAMDFFTSYDDRWSRAGLAGLATLLGSKAMGAGWGTAGTLAALAGTGAYNTHNYDAIKNRVTEWLGLGKKEQAPKPAPKPLTQNQKQILQAKVKQLQLRNGSQRLQAVRDMLPVSTNQKFMRGLKDWQLGQQWQQWQEQARQDAEAYNNNNPHVLGAHSRPAIGPDSRTYIQQYNDQGTPVKGAQITAKQQAQLEQKIKHDLAVALRLIKNKPAQSLLRTYADALQRIKSKLAPAKPAPYKPLAPAATTPAQTQINNAILDASGSKQPGLILNPAINNMHPFDYFSSPALIDKIYSK